MRATSSKAYEEGRKQLLGMATLRVRLHGTGTREERQFDHLVVRRCGPFTNALRSELGSQSFPILANCVRARAQHELRLVQILSHSSNLQRGRQLFRPADDGFIDP